MKETAIAIYIYKFQIDKNFSFFHELEQVGIDLFVLFDVKFKYNV